MNSATQHPTPNLAVIILAAGKGTRMQSALPKVLHPIAGQPMLWHVLTAAQALKPSRVVVVTGFGAEDVESMVKSSFPDATNLAFVRQEDQLGTAHAVLQAAPVLHDFQGEIVILYGDAPLVTASTIQQLISTHHRQQAALTVLSTQVEDPTGFGRIVRDANGQLLKSVEEKNATDAERKITEVNTCIFACGSPLLWQLLDQVQPSPPKNEYYLTDILQLALKQNLPTQAAETPGGWQLLGINDLDQLAQGEGIFRGRKHG